jgi:hypothetical protein
MAKSKQQGQREANTARIQRELNQAEGKLKGSLLKAKINPLKQALANKAETQARLKKKQATSKAAVNKSKAAMDAGQKKVDAAKTTQGRLRRKTLLIEAQKGARKAGEHAASNVKKHTLKERAARALSIAGYAVPGGAAAKAGFTAGKALLTAAAKKVAGKTFRKRAHKAAVKEGNKIRTNALKREDTGAKFPEHAKPRLMKKVNEIYGKGKKTASDANTKADRKSLNIGQGTAKNRRKPPSNHLISERRTPKDPYPGAPISSNLKTGARKKKRYDTKGREY